MTTEAEAARLREMFFAVASEVPDVAPAVRPVRRPRRSWRRRTGLAVGAAAVVTFGAGATAVAATGVWPGGRSAEKALGPSTAIITAPDPADVPGAVVRTRTPGPEHTVLEVTSAEGTTSGGCVALAVLAGSRPVGTLSGQGACSVVLDPSGRAAPNPGAAYRGGRTVAFWTSPTGHRYTIVYGQAPAGTTTVALTDVEGRTTVTMATPSGWYALAVPSATYPGQVPPVFR